MRKVFLSKVYDTETAEVLLHHSWDTYHPNLSGGSPTLYHVRAVYRTKKGTLFGYAYDEEGYGRNRDGATGAFVRKYEEIFPFFSGEKEALRWCEDQEATLGRDVFYADDLVKVFTIEEA